MEATALDFLKTQLKFSDEDVISKNIDGISNDEAMIFPDGNVNCVNWIMGHLIFMRNNLIQILGGKPVWDNADFKFYDRYAKPLESKDQFPDFETLKTYYKKSTTALNSAIEKTESANSADLGDLAGLMLHEIYHGGQFGILRKLLGKDGAV